MLDSSRATQQRSVEERLRLLLALSMRLADLRELSQIEQLLREAALSALGATGCDLLPVPDGLLTALPGPSADGIHRHALGTQEPAATAMLSGQPIFFETSADLPLLIDDVPVGVLSLRWDAARVWSGTERQLAHDLAALAASACGRLRRPPTREEEPPATAQYGGGIVLSLAGLREQLEIEQQLRASEATLRATLDALPVGVIIADADGRIVHVNAANNRLWGVPPETNSWEQYSEWVGFWPESGERIKAHEWAMARALLTGEVVTGELVECQQFGSGERRFFLNNAAPIRDAAGTIIGGVVAELDVTESRQAQERLRASEERYRAFIANSSEGVYRIEFRPSIDTSLPVERQIALLYERGRFAECNNAFARMYGFEQADELVGQALDLMLPPAEESSWHYLRSLIAAGYRAEDVESAERDRNGARLYFVNTLTGVREAGQLVRAWGTQRDITARKQAEEQLQLLFLREQEARASAEEASRLKDEFLATVSHELRTPLTALLGYAQLLQLRKRDEAYVARTVEKMVQSATAQSRLIEDLLDVSQIVSGKLRIEPTPLDLLQIVNVAADTVRPMVEAKQQELLLDLAPGAGTIVGDESRMQQVVWNLLSNAAKFTPAGGRIEVRLRQQGQLAELSVHDNGQGISPEFLPFVFDRFRQADSTTTRKYSGLGLGLAIVRHLVELHGGSVDATSPGEGQGAAFVVRLPLVRAAPRPVGPGEPETAPDHCPPELAGLRLLIVDDQVEIRELLQEIFDACGSELRCCATAREALETLRTWRPDLLISDIAMPAQDGFWLIEQVRALPPERGGAIPAVALTAHARAEDERQIRAAGFQQFIAKPIEPLALRALIAQLARSL
jgi:PAS domain S-box-containing protein